MRDNPVKQKLAAGGVAMGVMCLEFATPGIGRLSAEAGAEFAVYDMEHNGWSLETVRNVIACGRSTDLAPLVRVPVADYHHVAHAMDVGAAGVVIPLVTCAEQMKRTVGYALYPPEGVRGCAFALAHDDYKGGDIVAKMRHANENVLIVAQIETADALARADEIAAVDGVDAIWIGQFDLTTSLGIPGQFDHPKFVDATKRIRDACHKHGKAAALAVMDPAALAAGPADGYRMLIYAGDLWIYQQALRRCFRQIREALPKS